MEFTTDVGVADIVNTSLAHAIFSQNNTTQTVLSNQTFVENNTKATGSLKSYPEILLFDLVIIPLPRMAYIIFGLTCLVTAVGLIGNALILITKGRTTPLKGHDILVSALAIFDCMALVPTALSQPCVYEVIGMDIRALSTVSCKLFMCVYQFVTFSSFTVVVLICLERFVAVWYPLRSRHVLSRTLVFRTLLITVTVLFMIYVSMAILYSEVSDGICVYNLAGKVYSSVLGTVPDTTAFMVIVASNFMLYFMILLIFTPMIIIKLYKQLLLRRQLTTTKQDDGHVRKSVRLMAGHLRKSVNLMAVVVDFLIFVAMPIGAGLLMSLVGNQPISMSEKRALLSAITLALLLNHSTNFVIYNAFDPGFRRKVFDLFCSKRGARQMMGLEDI